ncbi:hypothetical protein HDV05_002889 [Chytridiales sp. JEL 0842]|nr:hypothetical protein HDV05_002889 [Chytridiales sp. JEL 0842]
MSSSIHNPPRRIIIIGGGLAGLTFALALKRVGRSTGLNLQPIIFESRTPDQVYSEKGPHYLLWRWAVEILVEMGLGGRLSKIAAPILKFQSNDAETEDPIVQWPPPLNTDPSKSSTVEAEIGADSALPPMVSTRRCDLLRLLLLALSGRRDDLIFGDDYLPTPANNSDMAPDPVTEDLEADLAQGDWFDREGFQELVSDIVFWGETLESYKVHPATGEVTARFESGRVERGSMLIGADGSHSKVRSLLVDSQQRHQATHVGACVLSGITRLFVPPPDTPDTLENGKPIEDLTKMDVQDFCPDGRATAVQAKGASFTLVNLGNGVLGWNLIVPQNEPRQHTDNYSLAKTKKMMSEAIAKNPRSSILMMPSSQMPNLKDVQTDARSAEDKWNDTTANTPVNDGLPMSPRAREITADLLEENSDEDQDVEQGAVDSAYIGSEVSKSSEEPASMSSSDETSSSPNAGEGSSTPDSITPPAFESPAGRRRRVRTSTPAINMSDINFQARLRAKLQNQSNLSRTASLPPAQVPIPSFAAVPSFLPHLFAPPEPLTGSEIRNLALRLAMDLKLPHPCMSVMARTDPALTFVQDVEDMADDPLESFSFQPVSSTLTAASIASSSYEMASGLLTSPTPISSLTTTIANNTPTLASLTSTFTTSFTSSSPSTPPPPHNTHQGRIILIGDAAHPLSTTPTTQLGACLALTDAALLAKLLAKHLASSTSTLNESKALHTTAAEFDKERVGVCNAIMKESRAEGGWGRVENGWVRGLMRLGRSLVPGTWERGGYAVMLTRGAVKSGLPGLMPVGAT